MPDQPALAGLPGIGGTGRSAGLRPGHFRGDRVWVAVAAESLVAHSGDMAAQPNCVALDLVRVIPRAHSVLLEFSGGVFVSLSYDAFARQKDNKGWMVEFPPEALRIL